MDKEMKFLRCKKCKSKEFINRVAIEIKGKEKIIWHRNPPLYCEKCGKAYNFLDMRKLVGGK